MRLFFRRSTREFYREARRSGQSLREFLHGYVYGRWPYLYIGVGKGTHPLARLFRPIATVAARVLNLPVIKSSGKVTFADTYHGKVVPLDAARQLVNVSQDITVTDLEQVIPYALARDIVLKNPQHIVALDCPCRVVSPNPCLPLDVCLIVGDPFASFVHEHHPQRARRITQQEATRILEEEHQRGHVHHAFFKDAMIGRFYAICNCCSCCCGAMHAWTHGTPMLASSGFVAELEPDECAGCGACANVCPFAAITMNNEHAQISWEKCMGCGVCVDKCPQQTLRLVRAPEKGEPLRLTELIPGAAENELLRQANA